MAAAHGSESPTPGIHSTSQTSTSIWAKCSVARSYILQGQKLKDEQLVQDETQHENTLAHNSVNFKYTASSPAESVSMSATNQTVPATQKMYRGNTVVYLHYLKRKIKLITSKINSYYHALDSEVKLINSKICLYTGDIDRRIQLVDAHKDSHSALIREIWHLTKARDLHVREAGMGQTCLKASHAKVLREIEILNAQKESYVRLITRRMERLRLDKDSGEKLEIQDLLKHDYAGCLQHFITKLNEKNAYALSLDMQIKLLTDNSHVEDLDRKIQLLSSKKDPSARKIIREIELLNATKDSYENDLDSRVHLLDEKVAFYYEDIKSHYRLLEYNKVPFAHDLSTHLKLLDSKLASFYGDFRKQQDQLGSDLDAYFFAIYRKMNVHIIIERI